MEYFGIQIQTDLETRTLKRDEDLDLFLLTAGIPVHLVELNKDFSRVQFPDSKMILLRLSPDSKKLTCHIFKDTDLYSSFVNFEVNKQLHTIYAIKQDGYIELKFE